MVQLHVQRTIAAPPERVFDWPADPTNLTAAPLFLKAGWTKDSSEPGVGAARQRVIRSFPAVQHEGGTLMFTPSGGGTHVDWVSIFTIPARGGGKVTEVITSPLFRSSFRAILAGCAKALES